MIKVSSLQGTSFHLQGRLAEALSSHATLVASQVERRLQVIDVEDDFIITDGERVKVVEVREQKPDFGGVVSNGSTGISTGPEGG